MEDIEMTQHADPIETSEFSKIPNKVLLLIFNQLSYADKLNCTLVCKKFNEIISTSDGFLNSTGLRLAENSFDQIDIFAAVPDFSITRNYRNISICLRYLTWDDEQVKRIFSEFTRISQHIRELHMCHIPGRFDIKVCQLLSNCKNLQGLGLIHVYLNIDHTQKTYPLLKSIKLMQLRTLRTHEICDWIFNFIVCKKLDSFRMIHSLKTKTIEFLQNLTRVNSLVLHQYCKLDNPFTPKFKWSQLRIEHSDECHDHPDTSDSVECLQMLLMAAAPNARLVIDNFKNFPRRLAFVMMRAGACDNITRFDIAIDGIDFEFMKHLKRAMFQAAPMKKITRLALKDSRSTPMSLQPGCLDFLLALMPNVEHLSISGNLMNVLDPATTSKLFGKIQSINYLDEPTQDELNEMMEVEESTRQLG